MSTQTTTQVVYRGHDNTTELFITRYVGRRYVPMDFSAVTRMVLSMPEASPNPYVFDTADLPGVIDWSGAPGSVTLNLQDYDIPPGVYVVSLVAYSPEWPNGYVVIDSRPSAFGELTFVEFRTVIGSGVLPPPIPGPPAGAVEIRFNGVPVVDSASVIDFTGSVEVEAAGGGAVTVNITGGGGSSGVESFNTRTGAVTLQGSDVTAALGYSPVDPSSLATVATSGQYSDISGVPSLATVATSGAYADLTGRPSLATVATSGQYADLSGRPNIPSTPGDIGAATDVQGGLADSALQPGDGADQLNMPTALLLGRTTAGTGPVEGITVGAGLSLAGGQLTATGGGGGGGQVDEVISGTGIAVDDTDPTAPIVGLDTTTQDELAKIGDVELALAAINGEGAALATAEWGTITGTLTDQTDLASELAARARVEGLPSRTVTASGAIAVTDAGHWLVCNSGAGITLTIDAEATAAWPSGVLSVVHIIQVGAGSVTVTGDGFSVVTHSDDEPETNGAGSVATLVRTGTNVWRMFGRLVAA